MWNYCILLSEKIIKQFYHMMSTSHIRICCCCCATINRVRFLLQNCPCLHQRGATNTIFGIITTQSSTFLVLRQTLTKSNFRQFTIGMFNCLFSKQCSQLIFLKNCNFPTVNFQDNFRFESYSWQQWTLQIAVQILNYFIENFSVYF